MSDTVAPHADHGSDEHVTSASGDTPAPTAQNNLGCSDAANCSIDVPAADAVDAPVVSKRGFPPGRCVICATFISHICTFGPLYSFGLFVPEFVSDFEVELDVASTMVSVMFAMQFFGGLLAGLLIPHTLSHRTVGGACAVLAMIGYVCASFAEGVIVMYAAMGLVGVGLGACNLAGLTALNASVKERRAVAVGIATAGTSVGAIVMPSVCSAAISSLGWRVTLRVFGVVTALALLVVAPCFSVSAGCKAAATKVNQQTQRPTEVAFVRTHFLAVLPCFDVAYLWWWCNTLVCFSGYFGPPTLLAQFATDELGVDKNTAATAYTIIGISSFAARVSLGFLTERCGGARRVHFASQVLNGLMGMLLPFCWSSWSLFVWSAMYGFTVGPVIALISVVLNELFGIERLPLNHGFSRSAVGIGTFCGPPLVSRLVVVAGFRFGLFVSGAFVFFSPLFLILLTRFHRPNPVAHGAAKTELAKTEDDQGSFEPVVKTISL
eukprot:TRINITY_DN31099_c0_g1_i1.p1 TRINITY_DN31099_c0_g1~~TRINITY_DN31099_c0_g1_i1.p1  ORF type:complete len:524 (+),score=61.24 TRINITY_DN31099_c0_g1_i1:93-1574(+)